MRIWQAELSDLEVLSKLDRHIAKAELEISIRLGRVLAAAEAGELSGWLRYNLFWDNTPFMNMLYVLEGKRGKGVGTMLARHWEEQMRQLGYRQVMTSTASGEYAQHFYYKLGYAAVGGFLPEGEPYEVILSKRLTVENVPAV